jgi:lysophospholipase
LGEPTIGWVCASLDVFKSLHAPHALAHLDETPILVAIATEETVVTKDPQRKLGGQFRAGKVITVQGAGHEILMETDERRAEFWQAFDDMCDRAGV